MAAADWTDISDALDANTVARAVVTTGVVAVPNGGGSFTFGMNSRTNAVGVMAKYTNLANFAPAAKGGEISAAIQRGISAGGVSFATFLFMQLGGTSSVDDCYMLGLGDSDPAHLILKKGKMSEGLPDIAPGTQGVLRRSTGAIALGSWVHLRLDCIKEPNGDVLLRCFQNDLAVNAVTAPAWVAIGGMTDFTDDATMINTGSAPLTSGRMGFGMYTRDVNRRSYFDQMVVQRQL